jgi:hypothetical protein
MSGKSAVRCGVRVVAASLGTALGLLAAGCSESTGPSTAQVPASCTATPVQLAPGAHTVIDPATTGGCVRIPAAGATGAEHLVVALSTTGQVTDTGLSAPFQLMAQLNTAPTALVAAGPNERRVRVPLRRAQQFDLMLRARGRALSQRGALAAAVRAPAAATTATLGSQRTFQVCAGSTTCNTFTSVTATLDHVGSHGLIYLDNAAPPGGYTAADLNQLGALFDNFMYPIDTTAFGHETDIDNNGHVIILLTSAVNAVSGNCNQTQSVVGGFFFPDDLVPGTPGSNAGEIFYGLVPDPSSAACTISRMFALQTLGPTVLHEFQHMISFGRHVVLNGGASEDNWLDEGLSRLAEELGGRQIPDSFCAPATCFSSYPAGDLGNAATYLQVDTLEATPLIEASNEGDGTLAEDGANWLFVRWLADHFATDSILGTSLTRALDGADSPNGTGLTGSINVSTITSVDFPTLVSQWQIANYTTSLSGVSDSAARLRYKSWNFRAVYTSLIGGYPLQPDSFTTTGTSYSHTGVLHEGSGRHLRVIQAPNGPVVGVTFTGSNGAVVSATMVPRFAVTRIR